MADLPPDLTPPGPPPGWYADPWVAGQVRWWDGAAWGSEAGSAAPQPPIMTTSYRPDQSVADPERALADERGAASSASAALIVGAVAYAVLFVAVAVLYHYVFHTVFDEIQRSSRSTTTRGATTQTFHLSPALVIAGGLLQFVQLGLYAVGAIFLAWFYKAAQLARAATLPAHRTPGLATAGFIIPIVSLWWPYQSVCDLFAPGDPRRRVVGRWWALWLCTQFGSLPVAFAAFGPLALGVVVALGLAAVAVLAAIAARRVIAEVGDAHTELVDRALGR